MIFALEIFIGVVVGVGFLLGVVAIVLKMPPSKNRLEPHSSGGDWWQNDGSEGGGGSGGGGHGHGGGH